MVLQSTLMFLLVHIIHSEIEDFVEISVVKSAHH